MLRRLSKSRPPRRGTVLPILAVTMVSIIGFLALSIDLGMLAVAKTQTQQAADLAALTAARTLNGVANSGYNEAQATTNAKNTLGYNKILNKSVAASQLSLTYGSFDYNQTTQTFGANYTTSPSVAETAVRATVSSVTVPGAFGKILGSAFIPSVTAVAEAVHRPRDIALAIDFSGSMRLGTESGFDFYTTSRTANNPDPINPSFGAYSSSSAVIQSGSSPRTSGAGYSIPGTNATATNSTYAQTYVNSFYSNSAFASTLIRAFDSYTSTDGGTTWSPPSGSATPQLPSNSYVTTPGGDVPLFKSGSTSTYATSVKDVLNSTTVNTMWEIDGYSGYVNGAPDTSSGGYPAIWGQKDYSASATQFNGYTQGPGYYGKTFYLWPPDPRDGACSSTNLASFLNALIAPGKTLLQQLLGQKNDVSQITNNWSTFYNQGQTTGLANLATYLTGASKGPADAKYLSANYMTQYITGTSNKASIGNAICRLFANGFPTGPGSNGSEVSADWRVQFFGTNDNTKLFSTSTGLLKVPSAATYTINYNAILQWITQPPNPFPSQLRAGRIKYYGAIPTAITGKWPNYGSTDQRFWVQFIDYTLGFWQATSGVYTDVSGMTGYGTDFTWGTNAITIPPTNIFGGIPQSMSYSDNPDRPLLRHWFGPLNMVDFLQNDNFFQSGVDNFYLMEPGDSYSAPSYVAKQGFEAAIDSMETNHPNDWVTIVPYSWARSTALDNTTGRFNCVRSPLGTNYTYASSALVFPFSTINSDGSSNGTEVTPYDPDPVTKLTPSADFMDTPRVAGNTSFAMGLMLSYNQFAVTPVSDGTLRNYATSSPITFPSGMAGGLGRKGAQKVIIFETDGMPNTTATASLVTNGSYNYYKIRYNMNNPTGSEYPVSVAYASNDSTVVSQVTTMIQQLVTSYGSSRNPFRLYAIGFGPVFTGSTAAAATSTLQQMQYAAGTQDSASTALPSNQILIGTDTQITAAMTDCYTGILQKGVQIALIR